MAIKKELLNEYEILNYKNKIKYKIIEEKVVIKSIDSNKCGTLNCTGKIKQELVKNFIISYCDDCKSRLMAFDSHFQE